MKKEHILLLCCPKCQGDLDLKILEEKSHDIITGTLLCKRCNTEYAIKDSIPHMVYP